MSNSRLRDQFIASLAFIKKPFLYDELVSAAAEWKKTGELDAVDYDQILVEVSKARRLQTLMSKERIRF